jgi:hypothetical protein
VAPPPGELDPRVLCLALVALTDSIDHPLDRLAQLLRDALGEGGVTITETNGHVERLAATIGGRRFDAFVRDGKITASDVHEVGGVVIRRQELDHGGLLAELALVMAPMAARDPRLRDALIALPTP